jgi:hypothetical protein
LIVLSWLPDATCRPSGENATTATPSVCPIDGVIVGLLATCDMHAALTAMKRFMQRNNLPRPRELSIVTWLFGTLARPIMRQW